MNEKRGYYELCLCGSGKEYENCCGRKDKTDCSISADFQTGTILDKYMTLFEVIMMHGREIAQFDKDGEELIEAWDDFEKRFRPGKKNGVPDSLFTTWLCLDFRFGNTFKTVCERFIESPYFDSFEESEQILIKNLASSYYAFYEAKGFLDNWIFFEELVTGKKWRAFCLEEQIKEYMIPGEIWFVRYIGDPHEAYEYGMPFVFSPESKNDFVEMIKNQKNVFLDMEFAKKLPNEELFRETCKFLTYSWSGYMMKSNPEFDENDANVSSASMLKKAEPKSAVKKKIQSGKKETHALQEKKDQLIVLTKGFCDKYLNAEYEQLFQKLINKMARKRNVPFVFGKIEIWAAAVIHAIGMINFLFDNSQSLHISVRDIFNYFNTNQSTTVQKSKLIRDMFKISYFDKEFSTDAIAKDNPLNDIAMLNGLIVPKDMLKMLR